MLSNAPGYAYCYYPTTDPLGGDVHLNPNYQNTIDTNGFEMPAGNHGYMTLIHETGHGLGLKHPHETPALPTIEDNTSNSVMSYRFTGNSAGTLMAYDLAALQQLYGTKAKEAGNTTYVFSSRIDQFTVNSVSPLTTPTNTKQLIWDTGGSDTLDFSTLAANSGGYRLDINEGGWLTTNAAYQYQVQFYDYNVTQQDITTTYFDWGTSLGYGVTIENLVNSVSADTIYANSAANTFGGYTTGRAVGADVLWNTNSADTLSLAGYTSTGVTRTQVGNDLVIGLGANGSVTVKNYYAGSQINIVYGGVTLPSITLSVSPASVTEDGSANLIYTFTRTGALTSALTVNYTVGGTATNGTDYASIATAVTFATGASTATVTVDPTADATVETNETIALTLAAGTGYTVGTTTAVTGTITDDDVTLPSITLTGTRTRVQEDGSLNLVYTFTRTGSTVDPLVINYTIGGTATMGADYGTIPTSLVFAPDAATATLNVDPFADNIVEADETITLTLATSANYTLGTTTAVTGTITDGNDNVIGTSANDSLDGGAGNDSLYGLAGNDVLNGGIGNDSLIGSVGIDTLTGGTGKDFFVFTTPSQGVDLFTDFRVVDDTIRLSASGFTGLLIGTLAPSAFLSGSGVTSANSTDQRLIYNTTNGALFFDADGSNTVANPIQLATLSNLPVLIPADFLVV
ncbi:MAG: sodium:calcium exchanger [Chlorogloea purpurea SAG 13.99]|nr:sodium:calcium exchanger [Chlorogloea purpurea SAG 13.99]